MKKLATLAAGLLFAGAAAAVDCSDCHESIDITMHTESEATLATCNDCHALGEHHAPDAEIHTPELTIKECTDCHGME